MNHQSEGASASVCFPSECGCVAFVPGGVVSHDDVEVISVVQYACVAHGVEMYHEFSDVVETRCPQGLAFFAAVLF